MSQQRETKTKILLNFYK